MSVFVRLTHEVPCVCVKMGGLSVFSGSFSLYLFVSQLSSVSDNTLTWSILCKTWGLSVCVCMSSRPDCKRLGHVLYLTHAAPRLTLPLVSLFPAAFITLLEGRRSGCSLWFECPRGQLHQTESTLGLLNRQQSSPVVKLNDWNVSGFATLQGLEVVSMTA